MKKNSLQLPMISKLISCCNHLDLLKADPMTESAEVVQSKYAFALPAFGDDLERIGGLDRAVHFELISSPELSGKLLVLGQLLSVWRLQPNSRVLVFSHYTRLLDIIGKYLDRQGMRHCRIDGGSSSSARQQTVDEFNDLDNKNNFVFLISTKAGGLGLNLTAANIVVLFDSSWNPAFDVQAQDRAYRLGQRRDVDVYRLISTGTIEDKTYCRQLYKMQLSSEALEGNREERFFEGVQGDKLRQGELFGVQNLVDYNPEGHLAELRRLYNWKDVASSMKPSSSSASSVAGRLTDVSSATRAAMQAARQGDFNLEQVGLVEDSPADENVEEELLKNKDEDIEMAQIFLAAYGIPIEDSLVKDPEITGSTKKKRKKRHAVTSEGGGLVENLTKMADSGHDQFGDEDFLAEEELVTEDDDMDDDVSSFGDDNLRNTPTPNVEEHIRLKVNDILQAHSHMAVDSKDFVKAGNELV